MEFSIVFEGQLANPTREGEQQMLRDCVEQAVYSEKMGFDRVWAVEHHSLKWYAHMSAPEIFLTWVAARTSRIRIGHGVVCMPFKFNHPIRVAERAAMLDILSGGRLDLGAGRGATKQEMSLFDVDEATTHAEVEEALRMIGHAWQEEKLTWDGLLKVDHEVLPHAVQEPHPPLYMACTRRASLELAAEYGVGALCFGFGGVEEIAELKAIYDKAIAERSGDRMVSTVANDHFSALCPTIVLDDAGEALRIGSRGQRFFAEAISHWYGVGPPPSGETVEDDNVAEIGESRDAVIAKLHEANIPVEPNQASVFRIDHGYGTAEQVTQYVQQLADAGADEVMCVMQMGTVPQWAAMETIRQWGEKIIPQFR